MQKLKDYYHILGVDKSATGDEIKQSYRKLAVKYHPDHNHGDKAAEDKFKLISEAYAVLIDKSKRARYDRDQRMRTGSAFGSKTSTTSKPGSQPDSGFTYTQEEIFRDFFAGAYARQAFRDLAEEFKRSGARFDDRFFNRVFFGGKGFFFGGVFFSTGRPDRVQRGAGPDFRTSFSHRGSQKKFQTPPEELKPRKKAGVITRLGRGAKRLVKGFLNPTPTLIPGPDINFNLTITSQQARQGTQLTVVYNRGGLPHQISVKIPPDTKSGTRLRLKEMGEKMAGGRSGDLFLHVRVAP